MSKSKVECNFCKKIIYKENSEIKRNKTQFCSRDCYMKSRKAKSKVIVSCSQCNKEFYKTPYNEKRYKNSFCSSACQKEYHKNKSDLTGKKVGRCQVISQYHEDDWKYKYIIKKWLLKCSCGEIFIRRNSDVVAGLVYECPNCVFRRSQYYIGGKKFGRLSVQDKWEWRISPTNGKRFRYWLCICECGNEKWIPASGILRGLTVSCGCFMQKNNSRYVNETLYPMRHGKSDKASYPIYNRWIALVHKCHNSKHQSYKNWGGQGYTVCDTWKNDFNSFHKWMIDNDFKDNLTVEIKEGKKEFSPKSCFLCVISEHNNRMRKITHLKKYGIEHNGEVKVLMDWAKEYKMSYQTLIGRWRECKDLEKCLDNTDWIDGSGCRIKRRDISDEKLIKLYEDGYSIHEIQENTDFQGVWNRLRNLGVKMRQRKSRSSILNENIINKMIKDGDSLEEIFEATSYSNKDNLKKKIKTMKLI